MIPVCKFALMPIPPINSLTNWFDFNNAVIVPTRRSLLKYDEEFSFIIANGNNRIIDMTICKNKSGRNDFSQDLKTKDVVWLIRHKIANGDSKISTFIIIYLKAKLIIRVKEDMYRVLDNMPSRENILKLLFSVLFISFVSVTNEISLPKISFPSSQKNDVSSQVVFMRNVQREREKFIKIEARIAFIKNFHGDSMLLPLRCERISLTQ